MANIWSTHELSQAYCRWFGFECLIQGNWVKKPKTDKNFLLAQHNILREPRLKTPQNPVWKLQKVGKTFWHIEFWSWEESGKFLVHSQNIDVEMPKASNLPHHNVSVREAKLIQRRNKMLKRPVKIKSVGGHLHHINFQQKA